MAIRESALEQFAQLIAMVARQLIYREREVDLLVVMGWKKTNLKKASDS
jgi:hypothetical protein